VADSILRWYARCLLLC